MHTVNVYLLENNIAPINGLIIDTLGLGRHTTFQGILSGTGTISATIDVKVSNDGLNWIVIRTLRLSDIDGLMDFFSNVGLWAYYTADLTQISGTGATASLIMVSHSEESH